MANLKSKEQMAMTLAMLRKSHRVNEDNSVTRTVNSNLKNLIVQILDAWEKQQDDEVNRLEHLALQEVLKARPYLTTAEAVIWVASTVAMFQTISIENQV